MADKNIQSLTAKTTPVDADSVPIHDSADTTEAKQVTWARIKAVLKTYFDSTYGTPVADEALGGSSVNRTLAHTPISGTLIIFDSAVKLTAGVDYTQTTTAVTFVVAPDDPRGFYRYA